VGKISDALDKFGQSAAGKTADLTGTPLSENVDLKPVKPIATATNKDRSIPAAEHPQDSQQDDDFTPQPTYSEFPPMVALQEKGQFPQSNRLADKLVAISAPHSYEAEQFRVLRTNIMFPAEGRATPRSILITSTHPNHGKSFVAANLAATIAQNIDRHVLLVDCDLRKPAINHFFGFSSGLPGLSDYLIKGKPLTQLLVRTGTPRLSILPGGLPPPNPSELLSSNRMAALMQELLNRYDDRYIIIDSPPPQVAAESTALAKFVEGIVLVIRIGHTQKEASALVVDKLGKEKIIGVVANGLTRRAVGYFGSGKYDQYAQYQKK
jgi:capsular exopolysaccharide synthesis family protein